MPTTTLEDLTTQTPSPALLHLSQVSVELTRDTPMMSFAAGSRGELYVGLSPKADPGARRSELLLSAPSPGDLVHFLVRAIAAVVAVAPDADPEPGPDPLVVEARKVLVEDVLRSLGVPKAGATIEIEELAVADIRVARRLAQRAVDLLDDALDGEDPPPLAACTASGEIGRSV